jgi:hypothetical protein
VTWETQFEPWVLEGKEGASVCGGDFGPRHRCAVERACACMCADCLVLEVMDQELLKDRHIAEAKIPLLEVFKANQTW